MTKRYIDKTKFPSLNMQQKIYVFLTLLVIFTSVKSSLPAFTKVSSIVTMEVEYKLMERV